MVKKFIIFKKVSKFFKFLIFYKRNITLINDINELKTNIFGIFGIGIFKYFLSLNISKV